jgi:hypothetical protein
MSSQPIEKFIQESTNNCVEKLQKVNIDQDVQEWVASHKTGTSPPPMPQFIPWVYIYFSFISLSSSLLVLLVDQFVTNLKIVVLFETNYKLFVVFLFR